MRQETIRTIKVAAITVFAVVMVEVIAMEILLRAQGFSAKEKPSWMETWFAQHARNVSVPSGARELKNPHPITEASMAEAREHWVAHCATCHGIDGRGDTVFGRRMYPPVPNVNKAQTQQKSDGELFYIISNGVRLTGMPAFGGEDSPESIWNLVALMRRLPQLSPDELKQMRQFAGEETMEEVPTESVLSAGRQGKNKTAQANAPSHEDESKAVEQKPKTKGHTHQQGANPHHH
jgi:mono/diheme cytochrome c family protein